MSPQIHQPTPNEFVYQGTADLSVEHYQYHLLDNGADIPDIPGQGGDGLVELGAHHGGAVIFTGTPWGPVKVTVEVRDTAPPLELGGWEYVVEVSQHTNNGEIVVTEPLGPIDNRLPVFETEPDSWYRIRAHARGRDVGSEQHDVPDKPVEHHLIQLWPAPPDAAIKHRLDDEVGRQHRHS